MQYLKIKKIINTILRIIGYCFIFMGIFIIVVGTGMIIEGKTDEGPSVVFLSLVFFIPGAILLFIEKRSRKEIDQLEVLSGIIDSYRRISITELAKKMNLTQEQTTKLLMKAIHRDIIEGNFDRTTEEFFTKEAEKITVCYRFCPNCGSPFDKIYLIGETVKCSRCGMMIHTKEAPDGN